MAPTYPVIRASMEPKARLHPAMYPVRAITLLPGSTPPATYGCSAETAKMRQGHTDYNNDLWKFNPSSGLWTWVSGSVAGTAGTGRPGIYAAQGASSTNNVPGGRSGRHLDRRRR